MDNKPLTKVCKKCGATVPASARFCPNCVRKARRKSWWIAPVVMVIVISLAAGLSYLGIKYIKIPTKVTTTVVNNNDTQSTKSKDFTTGKEAKQSADSLKNSGIKVKKKFLGDVEITLPSYYSKLVGNSIDFNNITDEQKAMGLKKIEKKKDGSIVYVIERSKYDNYLAQIKKTAIDGFNEILKSGAYKSISKVDYSDDFGTITITADKAQFENSYDSAVVLSCGLSGMMYQMFDVDAKQKVTVNVKDTKTGKVFRTTVYPDDFD